MNQLIFWGKKVIHLRNLVVRHSSIQLSADSPHAAWSCVPYLNAMVLGMAIPRALVPTPNFGQQSKQSQVSLNKSGWGLIKWRSGPPTSWNHGAREIYGRRQWAPSTDFTEPDFWLGSSIPPGGSYFLRWCCRKKRFARCSDRPRKSRFVFEIPVIINRHEHSFTSQQFLEICRQFWNFKLCAKIF